MLANINEEQEANIYECRICHGNNTRDLILSPCLCRGSMGCVHIRCLEQWLNVSAQNYCELCSYKFEVIQVRRYSFLQSIRVWLRQDHGSLYKTILFVMLCAVNTTLLCWMWLVWMSNFPTTPINENETKHRGENHISPDSKEKENVTKTKWIIVFVFLSILTLFSIKSLCFDACRVLKSQYHNWYIWWNETVNVQLVFDLQNYKISNKLEQANYPSDKYIKEKSHNLKDSNLEYKMEQANDRHAQFTEEKSHNDPEESAVQYKNTKQTHGFSIKSFTVQEDSDLKYNMEQEIDHCKSSHIVHSHLDHNTREQSNDQFVLIIEETSQKMNENSDLEENKLSDTYDDSQNGVVKSNKDVQPKVHGIH